MSTAPASYAQCPVTAQMVLVPTLAAHLNAALGLMQTRGTCADALQVAGDLATKYHVAPPVWEAGAPTDVRMQQLGLFRDALRPHFDRGIASIANSKTPVIWFNSNYLKEVRIRDLWEAGIITIEGTRALEINVKKHAIRMRRSALAVFRKSANWFAPSRFIPRLAAYAFIIKELIERQAWNGTLITAGAMILFEAGAKFFFDARYRDRPLDEIATADAALAGIQRMFDIFPPSDDGKGG